ncbi:hypothetical protein ACOSQ4_023264 [Xanthoceras sorbifolium]
MESLRISAKFVGTEVEFDVDNPSTYTMATLCADVYMYGCSTFPEPTKSFKVEALMPWRGIFRVIADDDDLQDLFAQYKSKHIRTIRLDVELLPLAWSPPNEFHGQELPPTDSDKSSNQPETAAKNTTDGFVEISYDEHSVSEGGTNNVSTSSNEDLDFLPRSSDEDTEIESDIGRHSFEFVQEDMFVKEGPINEEEQQPEAETARGDAPQQPDGETAQGDYEQQQTEGNAADGDDEQQQTDSGSESEEDVLSDAASFHFDQDFTVLSSSDDGVMTDKATKINITKKTVQSSCTRTSKNRLNFEVGCSSKEPTKKTVVDSTVEGVGSSQPVQQTVIDVGSSQPVTQTAPLHSSQVPTQQAQSKSNPGTVAGLDIDWSGMF